MLILEATVARIHLCQLHQWNIQTFPWPNLLVQGPDASSELGMIELLRSGAPAAMPLLTHLLRAKVGAGGAQLQQGSAGGAGQQQEGQPAQPDSPCYSCSEDDGDVGGPAPSGSSAEGLTESPLLQAERICRRFGLNQEQGEVLQYVASWCQPGGGTGSAGTRACGRAAAGVPPPICLVHGPFGSGEGGSLWSGPSRRACSCSAPAVL